MGTTLVNLARMGTSTNGTGPITLTTAVPGYLTFAQAGVADGQTVSYGIRDGANSEASQGVYTAASKTLTRSVINSTNANSPINLTTNAQVYATALAEDINAKVAKAGDTMTGNLYIADTVVARHAANDAGVCISGSNGAYGLLQGCNYAVSTFTKDLVLNQFGGNVGIGTAAPGAKLDVNGGINAASTVLLTGAEGSQFRMSLGGQSWTINQQSGGNFYVADATAFVYPLIIDKVTGLVHLNNGVAIGSLTASTSTTTGALTVSGGVGISGDLYVAAGAVHGSPTGGNKGAGTINAVSVYDDNVLLTCVGVEYLKHGTVDLAQWDALSPVKHHKTAHRFVELVKTFDPRDPKQYIDRMLQDEALPGMPTMDGWRHGDMSLGEIHNRLWLATELLASAFVGLHNDYENRLATLMQRVEALEKRT